MTDSNETNIVIEDDVPIPPDRVNFRATLNQLKVGQSFRVSTTYWTSLRNAATAMKKNGNKRFKVVKVHEAVDKKKPKVKDDFVRAWRIS